MSIPVIRQALESHLKTLAPAFPTAWQNVNFNPVSGEPFQSADFLFAEPDDRGFHDSPYIQRGILAIGLYYSINQGPKLAQDKAEEIRNHFERGTTVSIAGSDVSVVIDRTPEVSGGGIEEDRFVVRIRIRFYAHIDRA